jgi:phage head maturation protease
MPKSSKRFIIHTESLNAQGFRMLTDGAILDDFEKNPVLLFNHIRPEGNAKNQILPIGYWEDIELNDGQISGVPFFDDKDEFAMNIYNKVESGVIKMCSAGAEPIETSTEKSLLLPGQQLATVTKWRLKEASICDIGANPDALAVALYDSDSKQISLSQGNIPVIISSTKSNMSKEAKAVKPAAKKGVQLSDEEKKGMTDAEKELASSDHETALADDEPATEDDKDKEIASLKARLAECEEKLKLAEEKLKLSETTEDEKKATELADAAVKMRKITLAQKPHFVRLAKVDYEGTMATLKSMKAAPSIKETLDGKKPEGGGEEDAEMVKLAAQSFDELFKNGGLEKLKTQAPEIYKLKFKGKFGREPKNV